MSGVAGSPPLFIVVSGGNTETDRGTLRVNTRAREAASGQLAYAAMKYGKWLVLFAAATGLAVLVSGWGSAGGVRGGGGAGYSKAAFITCIRHYRVRTPDIISHPTTADDKALAKVLKASSPDFFAARFPNGQLVAAAFASDSPGAAHILSRVLQQFAKHPDATTHRVVQSGNVVLVMSPHIAVNVRTVISICETASAIK